MEWGACVWGEKAQLYPIARWCSGVRNVINVHGLSLYFYNFGNFVEMGVNAFFLISSSEWSFISFELSYWGILMNLWDIVNFFFLIIYFFMEF